MPISYAGVNLPLITPEAAQWANAALRFEDLDIFQIRHDPSFTQVRLSIPNTEAEFHPKLGVLQWPNDAHRWAVGLYLATDAQLNEIRTACYTGSTGYSSQPLVLDDGSGVSGHSISTNLWLLPSYPVVQIPGMAQMYLLILVDDRFFWWSQDVTLTIMSGTTTYANLYADFSMVVGSTTTTVTPDAGGVFSAYQKPGTAYSNQPELIPYTLDSIAYNAGQRVIRQLNGTVQTVNVGTAQGLVSTDLAQGFPLLVGGDLAFTGTGNDSVSMTPAVASVYFPNPGTTPSTYTHAFSTPNNGTTKVWKSTGLSDSVWFVGTALQTFVDKFAEDWLAWQLGQVNLAYAGICQWNPTGLEDKIEWIYYDGAIATRVLRGPLQDLTEDLIHAAVSEVDDTTVFVKPVTFNDPVNMTGRLTPTGGVALPQGTPSTLSAGTTNNWNPGVNNSILDIGASGPATVTGMVAPSNGDGLLTALINTGSNPITFTSQDSGSSADNQWLTPGGTPYVLTAGNTVWSKYDGSTNTNRLLISPSTGGGSGSVSVQINTTTPQYGFTKLNLIAGTNITETIASNSPNSSIDITINAIPSGPNGSTSGSGTPGAIQSSINGVFWGDANNTWNPIGQQGYTNGNDTFGSTAYTGYTWFYNNAGVAAYLAVNYYDADAGVRKYWSYEGDAGDGGSGAMLARLSGYDGVTYFAGKFAYTNPKSGTSTAAQICDSNYGFNATVGPINAAGGYYANGAAGLSTTITYQKTLTTTGTLTFSGGILTGST